MIQRSRSRGSIISDPLGAALWTYNSPDCFTSAAWSSVPLASVDWYGKIESMSDFVVPRFRERIAQGEVFFNDLVQESIEVHKAVGIDGGIRSKSFTCDGTSKKYKTEWRTTSAGRSIFNSMLNGSTRSLSSVVPYGDVSRLVAEVNTRMLAERGRTDQNLYESLAEVNKTLGVLNSIFKSGLNSVKQKRRKLERARDLGSAWLAYRYGLTPLMNDVDAILSRINAISGKVRVTSRAQGQTSASKQTYSVVGVAGMQLVDMIQETSETVSVRAMSLDEYVASLLTQSGFHQKGLATLPWELLPYSFVVDWFVNVGDFINALVPVAGLTQLGSALTVERKRELVITATNQRPLSADHEITTAYGGSKRATHILKSRAKGSVPELVVKQDFRLDNLTRCLDSVSLIIGALPKPVVRGYIPTVYNA